MVAARANRPFSLDHKLPDLDSYLPTHTRVCEIRLLAVEKEFRGGRIIKGLLTKLSDYCMTMGYDLAVVSGRVREQRFYERLGFASFGPLVGSHEAQYQPMYGIPHLMRERFKEHFATAAASKDGKSAVNLLPGPVGVSSRVEKAFHEAPVSHRSATFVEDLDSTNRLLRELAGSRQVELLIGSGTLANDVVAGQLSLTSDKGLVLSNGEFGERLIDHARRSRLSFDTLRLEWGDVFSPSNIERGLERNPDAMWVWAVHCETSTGVLNDLDTLKRLCEKRSVRLCIDCISSIGTVPVDLGGVYLASGVSGKGLGAFPGLSMVFYDHEVSSAPDALPRYLDLGLHASMNGIPFTHSSNLVRALRAALERFASPDVFDEIAGLSAWLRRSIRELGFRIVSPDRQASPAVTTIALPDTMSSGEMGRRMEEAGYLLSYNSNYLLRHNWIQICLMGGMLARGPYPSTGRHGPIPAR
jgi:aspartate aminotransferase-like enzyme/GNAT superfamily N-acetyltransferase